MLRIHINKKADIIRNFLLSTKSATVSITQAPLQVDAVTKSILTAPYGQKKGVISVTINYRLGPMGFICLPELHEEAGHTGNYGLFDQITAIQWVKNNIYIGGMRKFVGHAPIMAVAAMAILYNEEKGILVSLNYVVLIVEIYEKKQKTI